MANLEIESADVIRLIVQFLQEHNLVNSLQTLQEESQVTLNTVDNVEKFIEDILHGRWDSVLEVATSLRLKSDVLVDLFEQIVIELAELRELDTARAILRQTPAMSFLKKDAPDRYLRLEHMLQRTFFDYAEAYPNGASKERRRQQIAAEMKSEVQSVPHGRLLTLLNQALKWQQHQGLLPKGTRFDLFRGTTPADVLEEEKCPSKPHKLIKFGAGSHAECVAFSGDGQYLVTGSSDGFIEVWDFDTGKLRKDLKYQADDDIMMHDDPVLCAAFSRDSELLATGGANGEIKVWRVATGSCVRKFPTAHTGAITSLYFARDGTQLLSTSADQTVRVHGLKSGRTLKELRGHTAAVTTAVFSEDDAAIISGSADGAVKVWDSKSTDCVDTWVAQPGSSAASVAVHSVSLWPTNSDQLLLCPRSNTVKVTTHAGKTIQAYTITSDKDVACCTVSPKGKYLFAVGGDAVLYCFAADGAKIESVVKLHEKEVTAVAHHPHRNILASISLDGTMKLWKP